MPNPLENRWQRSVHGVGLRFPRLMSTLSERPGARSGASRAKQGASSELFTDPV